MVPPKAGDRGHPLLKLEDALQEVRMAITEAETINADLAFIKSA